MDITSLPLVSAVSAVLLAAAAILMILNARAWRDYQQAGLESNELTYRRRQCRRRMQASVMLGIVALTMFGGYVLTLWQQTKLYAIVFWAVGMFVLAWVVILAGIDILATKLYYGRLLQRQKIEEVALEAQLRHKRATQGNGKPNKKYHTPANGNGKDTP